MKIECFGPGTRIARTAMAKIKIVLIAPMIPALPGLQETPGDLHSSAEKAENIKALQKNANGRRIRMMKRKRRLKWCLVTNNTIPETRTTDKPRMRLVRTPKTRAAMNAPLKPESEV
jgi:hypothetical protein